MILIDAFLGYLIIYPTCHCELDKTFKAIKNWYWNNVAKKEESIGSWSWTPQNDMDSIDCIH